MNLRIREIRKSRGLTQQELADKARIGRSQLSQIEAEKLPANTRRLADIAAALGVQVQDLFSADAVSAYVTEIAELTDRMSPEDRQAILRMARALAGSSPEDGPAS